MNLSRVLCFECDNDAREMHHVIPASMGGRRAIPLCHECHGKVHGMGRKHVSELTKAGLLRAKERGVKLGMANRDKAEVAKAVAAASALRTARADAFANQILPILKEFREAGIESLSSMAFELNARNILTARGATWYPTTVRNLLARYTRRGLI